MKKLRLQSFKAYHDLEISFDNKNFLLYGDNGAGKSSIYDAFKIKFFEAKIIDNIGISGGDTPEEIIQKKNDYFSTYNNNILNNDFTIEINENDFNRNDYSVAMINLKSTSISNNIYLDDLLKQIDFNLPDNYLDSYKDIRKRINKNLKKFLEDIRVVIDKYDNYAIRITDKSRNIKKEKNIKEYFNEAKLNLVVLSIIFSVIDMFQDRNKKRILILDDFITSLDMSNRTFLIKHILDTFINDNSQIIIFTHNVYFYNLIMYLINDVYKSQNKWRYSNLYEISGKHQIYMNSDIIKISDIENQLNDTPQNFQIIGNQIRQKFERLLYEFSKILMIGSVEDSNKILELIENSKNIYLKHPNKTCNDLVNEIQEVLDSSNQNNLRDRINRKIDNYQLDELNNIRDILKELKLYKKVSMNSLSHARMGQSNWSEKEIKQSLLLLKRLELSVKKMNVSEQRRTDGL